MIDKTDKEQASIDSAAQMGAEYLTERQTYDMSKLTTAQYLEFVECIITGYVEKLKEVEKPLLPIGIEIK